MALSVKDMAPGTTHPRAQPIGVVARSVVHDLLTNADSDDIALWEDYSEIGENDWDEVIAAARALAPAAPTDAEYRAAYAALNPSTIRNVTPPSADGDGAPRQAGTMTSGQPVGAVNVLRELGIAVRVGTLVPSGAAVRVDIDDTARWLDPNEARTLAVALEQAAVYAADQDRAARRG